MLSTSSSILNTPYAIARRVCYFIIPLLLILALTGCGPKNYLHEYDFRGATVAVDALHAPIPQVRTEAFWDAADDVSEGDPISIFHAATTVVKGVKGLKAEKKLARAARNVDVSGLMAYELTHEAARYLRAEPSDDTIDSEFLIFLSIKDHGIYAGEYPEGVMEYFVDAEVELFDNFSGRRIWKKGISTHEPIHGNWLPLFGNIRSANTLDKMTEDEMAEALERLSEYSAQSIARLLADDLRRSRRR